LESEFIFPNGKEKMKRNRDEDEFSPLTIDSEASESFVDHSSVDYHTIFSKMLEDAREIEEGDLSGLEKRLVGQITTLDTLFLGGDKIRYPSEPSKHIRIIWGRAKDRNTVHIHNHCFYNLCSKDDEILALPNVMDSHDED